MRDGTKVVLVNEQVISHKCRLHFLRYFVMLKIKSFLFGKAFRSFLVFLEIFRAMRFQLNYTRSWAPDYTNFFCTEFSACSNLSKILTLFHCMYKSKLLLTNL